MAQSDFWTRWQHPLLVHGAVLSQAGLFWEMSVSSTVWPFSQVLLLTQELELEEDGLWRMAKLPCQCSTGDRIWILSRVLQGKIHFRLKKNIKVLKVELTIFSYLGECLLLMSSLWWGAWVTARLWNMAKSFWVDSSFHVQAKPERQSRAA